MSQTDSFVDEVNEELRRDRLFATLRKWGPLALLAVLALVGYAAWSEWQDARVQAAAEKKGDAIYAALDAGDATAQAEALAGLEPGGPLTALLRAAALEEAGKRDEAIAVLDVAQAWGAEPRLADLVAIKRQMLAAERDTLEALAQPGRPYHLLASEQLALLDLNSGDAEAAMATAQAIIDDAEVTPGLRDRMQTLIVSLGGTLDAE